ncbi:MAG: hypothetical protein JSR75_04020 [Proteobacteria bacterium]|nr:hypothetical protein [Pseudomonadota bacterium]
MTFGFAFDCIVRAVVFVYLVGTAAMLVAMLVERCRCTVVESAGRHDAVARIAERAATFDRGGFASHQTDAAAANEPLKMAA